MKKNNPIYLASRNTVALLLGLVMLAACATQPTSANRSMGSGLTFATPESVGLDSDRLDRLTQAMQGFVDDGRLAGVVTAAARDGKIIHFESVGQRDIATGSPMTEDALFRIYSMTKPITSVAAMTLFEEGLFQLDDPVARFLPEFADMQLWIDGEGDAMRTEAVGDALKIWHLLTHTAGLVYGWRDDIPVGLANRAAGVEFSGSKNTATLADMTRLCATMPLRWRPGSRWEYSVATDVLGRLIEVVAVKPLDVALRERLFDPPGLNQPHLQQPV